jgi:hypothetical protein
MAGRATGYTDFYKKGTKTPSSKTDPLTGRKVPLEDEEDEVDPRKEAIRRRLGAKPNLGTAPVKRTRRMR